MNKFNIPPRQATTATGIQPPEGRQFTPEQLAKLKQILDQQMVMGICLVDGR